MNTESVADRIRLARKMTGLNQEQFGRVAGVSKSAVSQWEAGKTELSPVSLFAIENAFGIRAEWIVTGQEPKNIEKTTADDQEFFAAYRNLSLEEKIALRVLVVRRPLPPAQGQGQGQGQGQVLERR